MKIFFISCVFAGLFALNSARAAQDSVGEITRGIEIVQDFRVERNNFCGVSVPLATFGRSNTSDLVLELLRLPEGKQVASRTLLGAEIKDNRTYTLEFPAIRDSADHDFTFKLYSSNAEAGNAVTAWIDRKSELKGTLSLNHHTMPGVLMMGIIYDEREQTPWHTADSIILLVALLALGWCVMKFASGQPKPEQPQQPFVNRKATLLQYGLTLLALMALHASRNMNQFRHPMLWCEEGMFLSRILEGHWTLVMAGYICLFSSLIVRLGLALSPHWLPWISGIAGVLVAAASVGYFLLPHWDKLVSRKYRWFAMVLFLGFSPYHEGIGLALYSAWYFGVGAGILLLELLYLPEDAAKHKYPKALYMLLGGLSGPPVLQAVVPILAGYFFVQWRRSDLFRAARLLFEKCRSPLILSFALTVALQLIIIVQSTVPSKLPTALEMTDFPKASIYQIHMQVVAPTLYGLTMTNTIINSSVVGTYLSLSVALLLTGLIFPILRRELSPVQEVSLTLLLAAIFCTWIAFLGRRAIMYDFRNTPWNVATHSMRYALIPGFLFLTGAILAFDGLTGTRKTILASILMPLVLVAGIENYPSRMDSSTSKDDWFVTAAQIEEWQRGERDDIDRTILPYGMCSITAHRTKK